MSPEPTPDNTGPESGELPGTARSARHRLALPGTAIVALGFAGTAGPVGAVASVLLLVAWALTPPVAVATLGIFLFVTVQPGGALGLLAAAGLALVLLGPTVRAAEPVKALLATVVLAFGLAGVVVWVTATVSATTAAGVLLLVAALVGYGIHRVAVVTVEATPTAEEVTQRG